jgi:hypothetical protein
VDGWRLSAAWVRQGQFAAFDPEPLEEDDEPVDGDEEDDDDDDEGAEDDDEDSLEDFPDKGLSAVALVEALSLALAAFRLSVR